MNTENAKCEECCGSSSEMTCLECEQAFCKACAMIIHKGGNRKSHTLITLFGNMAMSEKSPGFSLENIEKPFEKPDFSKKNASRLRVYWDLGQDFPVIDQLKETVNLIEKKYSNVKKIQAYGKSYTGFQEFFQRNRVELRGKEGIKEIESILFDISMETSDFDKVILITSRPHLYKPQLLQLLAQKPNLDIKLVLSPRKIIENPIDFLQIPEKLENIYKISRRRAAASEDSLDLCMSTYLKEQALKGIIMYEATEFAIDMANYFKISLANSKELLRTSIKLGKLHLQVKKIGTKELEVVSQKIEKLTPEILLFVLRSLKNDEMIPTEKAIQSRVKETYEFKVSTLQIANITEACRVNKGFHKKSASEASTFSYFSQNNFKKPQNLNFWVKVLNDSNTETKAIYPVNEEWVSYDQYIKSGDVFKIKKTSDWAAFLAFFEEYFNIQSPEDQAISGGRYGCAQFLKNCSNWQLKKCSLGKLSYMVQLAIDEELLRYHKTLLIWVHALENRVKDDKNELYTVKNAVVEVLKDSIDGVSLAQLPLFLKEKIQFELDLSKLGFAKLKDLICTIPDVEIVSKGKNHPFARLKKIIYPSPEGLTRFIHLKLDEKDAEFTLKTMEQEIFDTFGYTLLWSTYKLKNFAEFIKQSADFQTTSTGKLIKKLIELKNFHSYTSSTNSESYSCGSHNNIITENLSNDLDQTKKTNIDSFEQFAAMQKRFIQKLLDEDDVSVNN